MIHQVNISDLDQDDVNAVNGAGLASTISHMLSPTDSGLNYIISQIAAGWNSVK